MNLRQLRYFAKVVEAGNMTRAAEALHVAQPALGLQIRQLEEELGVPLLVRHSRGVSPTEAGALLFERAQEIARLVGSAARDVSALSGRAKERLRIGLSPSLMGAFGPELVVRARAALPELSIVLVEDLSYGLVDAVMADEIELALAYEVDEQASLARDLLMEEDLLIVASPARLGGAQSLSLIDALGHPLVLGGKRDAVRRMVEMMAERLTLTPTIAFEVQSITVMKALALRDLAVAVLPRASVAAELERGLLAAVPIVEPALARRLFLVKAAQRPPLTQEGAFVALIGAMVAQHAAASQGLARLIAPRGP